MAEDWDLEDWDSPFSDYLVIPTKEASRSEEPRPVSPVANSLSEVPRSASALTPALWGPPRLALATGTSLPDDLINQGQGATVATSFPGNSDQSSPTATQTPEPAREPLIRPGTFPISWRQRAAIKSCEKYLDKASNEICLHVLRHLQGATVSPNGDVDIEFYTYLDGQTPAFDVIDLASSLVHSRQGDAEDKNRSFNLVADEYRVRYRNGVLCLYPTHNDLKEEFCSWGYRLPEVFYDIVAFGGTAMYGFAWTGSKWWPLKAAVAVALGPDKVVVKDDDRPAGERRWDWKALEGIVEKLLEESPEPNRLGVAAWGEVWNEILRSMAIRRRIDGGD